MSGGSLLTGAPAATRSALLHRPRVRAVVLLALGLLWLAVVLCSYYTQMWHSPRQLLSLLVGWGDSAGPAWLPSGPKLPYLGEALGRAGWGVGGSGLLLSSALLLGVFAGRAAGWRYAGWQEHVPFAMALGIGYFAYAGLGLAAFGLYRPVLLRLLVPLPLLAGLAWMLARGHNPLRGAGRSLHLSLPLASTWPWIGCAVLAVGCAFVAALAPEIEYDALWYHLAYPQRYLQHGRLVDLPADYVSLYPMTWELWFGYGLAAGGPIAAKLLHFACLPLTALLVYRLARRFVSRGWAWAALALFVTVPTVTWEASTAYIDLALAFHVTLVLYALLRYVERRQRQWLLLAALNLGLALATKHLTLVVVALACAGLLLWLWQRERSLRRALPPVLMLGGLALVLALPWYVRSFLASGNPVFPELFEFFGAPAERWDAVTEQGLQAFLDRFGRSRTLPHLLALPWHATVHAAAYHGSLGPLFLLLLPFLTLRRWQRWRGALPWLAAFVLLFVAFWASPFSSFQMRFLVPIVPVLAVLASVALARLAALARAAVGRRGGILLAALVALLLVLNLPAFTALHETDRVGWDGWLNSVLHGLPLKVVLGAESGEAYLSRTVRSYPAWRAANRSLPQEARVLTWSGGDQFYAQRERLWAYAAVTRPVAWADGSTGAAVFSDLDALGITHLIVDPAAREQVQGWGTGAGRPDWYEVLYEDRFYSLYRLRWEVLR